MNIYDLDIDDLEKYFLSIGDKKFHAKQLFTWLYEKKKTLDEITDIKKETKEKMKKDFSFKKLDIIKKENDTDVAKYLFKLEDNQLIEAVLMNHDYGISVCISSQVGCNMGCKFCESGRRKKVRNLKVSEMVLQILQIEDDIKSRISNIVIMGIGEPFDNYCNVMKFIKIVNHPNGLKIGSRKITVSTCGIIPKIEEFSNFSLQVNLAISLHASNDKLRSSLMPINKVYPLDALIRTLKKYIEKTNRRVTFEYILLDKINDSVENANELAKLIKGMNAYVNLIPYNETENLGFNRSKTIQIMKFYDILKKNKINVTIRKEFGNNITAACGQLRSKEEIT